MYQNKIRVSVEVSGAEEKFLNGTYFLTDENELKDYPDELKHSLVYIRTDSLTKYNNKLNLLRKNIDDEKWFIEQWTRKKKEFFTEEYYCVDVPSQYLSDSSDEVNDILETPPKKGWEALDGGDPSSLRTRTRRIWVFDPLKKMLFSEKFSDIHFHCPDGTILHAHKNILSAQSTYFATVFEGPWDEEHADGVWITSNSSVTMKAILTFIYTDEVHNRMSLVELIDLLSLSHQYEMHTLLQVIASKLIPLIDLENIKAITQCAYTFDLKALKYSCLLYINENYHTVLMDVKFMNLASENTSIWLHLQSDLKENSRRVWKKRKTNK